MKWEIPFKIFRSNYVKPVKRFQYIEITLRGMEMAVTSATSFPMQTFDGLPRVLEELTCLTIKKVKSYQILCNSMTGPESNEECSLKNFQTIPTISQNLPFFFFLFCMKLLNCPMPKTDGSTNSCEEHVLSFNEAWTSWACKVKSKRFMPACKCSFSLGLAVLFGLLFSKPNGIWSGLSVAISFATAREATFKVANVKAQGTVLGTVYGVLGCFLFEKLLPIRFLLLFPWFIFTSFLRHGRMYGQGGGISAVIGAVLILGRKTLALLKNLL